MVRNFPGLKVVSRDRPITYSNAIAYAQPNAFQVSDRFHLLMLCLFEIILKVDVKINATSSTREEKNKKLTLKEKSKKECSFEGRLF